jgi:DNA mismatch repair protein MLH3
VRIKQRSTRSAGQLGNWRDLEELRKELTGILLAWTTNVTVIVTVKDGASSQKIQLRASKTVERFDTEVGFLTHVCSTLSHAEFISSAEKPSWISMHASTRKLSILGAVSLEPAPTKIVQFISFGINPLFSRDGHNILYEDINRLFRNSFFGSEDTIDDMNERREIRGPNDRRWKSDGFSNKELKIPRRGVDRHPMFVIKIQASSRDPSYVGDDINDLMNDKHGTLGSVTELLHAMILEFLRVHKFQPKTTRPLFNPNGHGFQSEENPLDSDPLLITEHTNESANSTPSSHETRVNSRAMRLGKAFGSGSGAQSPNVRLPSITQAHLEQTESPFDGWSRVKRGKRTPATKNSIGHSDCPTRISQQVSTTIVKSGKVAQQPFGDLPLPMSVGLGVIDDSFEDDITTWVNPITTETFLVNSRTGFVVLPIKLNKQSAYQQSFRTEDAQCRAPTVSEASTQRSDHLASSQSSWIGEVLRNWDNPVFRPTEPEIPQISVDGIYGGLGAQCERKRKFTQPETGKTLREIPGGLGGRISKEALSRAEIVSQVDKKFVLTKIRGNSTTSDSCDIVGSKETLVMVDQHAADERYRVEELLKELCTKAQDHNSHPEAPLVAPEVRTTSLEKPLCLAVSHQEAQLLRTYMPHFVRWGILYDLPQPSNNTGPRQQQNIVVRSLPAGIVERCKVDSKLLIDLIRSEAWKCAENELRHSDWPKSNINQDIGIGEREHEAKHNWIRNMHDCPQGILDLLNSRACRSM